MVNIKPLKDFGMFTSIIKIPMEIKNGQQTGHDLEYDK